MLVPCRVSAGLRDQEVFVEVTDFSGQPESMPLDSDFVVYEKERAFLPVHVLYRNEEQRAALIALPVESDSGAHRIWVTLDGTRTMEETPA